MIAGGGRVDPAPQGKALLTYGALLHLEFGVIKLLFQEKIRGALAACVCD
ncbi:hypothetical protein [Polyangium sp. 15x6]|nr:hypothetical protein [Polyangium sp. 15x6]MDI3283546.1 hypothetical protein [Polyangium sp. 15x6]